MRTGAGEVLWVLKNLPPLLFCWGQPGFHSGKEYVLATHVLDAIYC
jgi:hypothetical protein